VHAVPQIVGEAMDIPGPRSIATISRTSSTAQSRASSRQSPQRERRTRVAGRDRGRVRQDSAWAKSAARSKVLRTRGLPLARIAPAAMAIATCDFPASGRPPTSTPPWSWQSARSPTRPSLAFRICVEVQSRSASAFTAMMPACLNRSAMKAR
jgi:hypothetical protein